MDSFNHNYGVFSNRTNSVAASLLANIKCIIDIFQRSDLGDTYTLAITSDHGGQ